VSRPSAPPGPPGGHGPPGRAPASIPWTQAGPLVRARNDRTSEPPPASYREVDEMCVDDLLVAEGADTVAAGAAAGR